MHQKKTLALTAISIAAALALAACGGGGGGDNSNASAPASTPAGGSAPQTSIPPKTSVPPTTFPATTMQAQAFSQINAYRLAMGVGELNQDSVLDTAAQAHALYLGSNLASGALTALSHDEIATFANFFGASALARAQKAGASPTEWIAEEAAAGLPQASAVDYASDCVGQLLSSVYHLQGLTSMQESVGIGFQQSFNSFPDYVCVTDFGETTGVSGTPQPNALLLSAGQQISSNSLVHSPLSNETAVATAMRQESPNPAPDLATPGRPIMVRVNAANPGDVLTVANFTLSTTGGTNVPARIIVPAAALTGSASNATADVANGLFAGVAFLLPLTPLSPNTTYSVSFNGARDGTPINAAWTFTTGN